MALADSGWHLVQRKNPIEGESLLRQGIAMFERLGYRSMSLVSVWRRLGLSQQQRGEMALARASLDAGYALCTDAESAGSLICVTIRANRAGLLAATAPDAALLDADAALAVMTERLATHTDSRAQALEARAAALSGLGRAVEAAVATQAALKLRQSGIKEALARGTQAAVSQLGRTDGFLKDEAVKIVLPKSLRKLGKAASRLGAGNLVDDLVLSMNRAAETAVPAAAGIFADAIRQMSVEDAIGIVRGGDTAGTDYFRRSAGAALEERFLPIVAEQTAKSGVSGYYKSLNAKAGGLMGLAGEQPDLDQYVTDKAIDGLFLYVAEQEKQIRKDPLGTGSDLLRQVFGR